jgi:DNA polymerase-1
LNTKATPISDLIGSGKKQLSMRDIPIKTVSNYACEDADMTLRLMNVLRPRLENEHMLNELRDVEVPFVEILADMEQTGVKVDCAVLKNLSSEFGMKIDELERAIYKMADERFNINSHRQVSAILYDKLGLPTYKKTKTGYSSDYEVLVRLSKIHPLPGTLLEYRTMTKLKSTYIDALPRMVNASTGRIHTSFHQTGTATGRLSSTDPNLQNIPVRSEIGKRIREAFVPGDKSMVFFSADYSQIDLRLLAHFSGDGELIDAFRKGEDIHRRTAAAVFGVDDEMVTPEMRRQAKTINFGIVYGMSSFGLSRDLGIGMEEAQSFIDRYFERYKGVRTYLDNCLARAEKDGYVTTLLRRRRYVPELSNKNYTTREFGRRIAVNTPIQGSSADLIKLAMLAIQQELKRGRWRAAMLIQIHDELLFEVDRAQADDFSAMVRSKMETIQSLRVPLKVYCKFGENWGVIE